MLIPVLLAGGVGTRLWPLSRQSRPKQFQALAGTAEDKSLLEQALARVKDLEALGPVLIVGNDEHRFVMAEQLRASGVGGKVLIEPVGRNTAPAVAAAAFDACARHGANAQLLVLPTDHAIGDAGAFADAVARARANTDRGRLTLFGVAPDRPETGYGYIQAGAVLADGVRSVQRFVEKPDAATASGYLADGGYFWNSGMFFFTAQDYLDALAEQAPAIHSAVAAAYDAVRADIDFLRLDKDAFAASPADSIDYAVMEKTDRAVMVELDAGWNDLGSWSAVARAAGRDARGNSTRGDVWLEDSDNCVVHSQGRLVATLGVREHVIVETADAVLVADRAREQDIKALVSRLAQSGRSEATEYRKAYRPWGSYEQIAAGARFQVKHIRVKPGGRLSLQSHHHRAEHWVVVHGTALVTCNERQMLLTENESTFIPLGATHRLENPGKLELDLIEVQSGSYLGEDDIVRYDDVYGRADAEPAAGNTIAGRNAVAAATPVSDDKE